MRVLIVEDSDRLRRSLRHGLARSGFAVDAVGDGREASAYLSSGVYDVVVLDLMLPGRDGLSLLRDLRSDGNDCHVLILSARDQIEDRVTGLELGADDYLVKPFSFDELLARLKALVRRRYRDKRPVLEVDGVEIDTRAREVRIEGHALSLSPKEYNVLEALCRRRGQVLSRQQLIDQTNDYGHDISNNAVDVLVCGLRRKLRRAGAADLVRTRRGFGYYVAAGR